MGKIEKIRLIEMPKEEMDQIIGGAVCGVYKTCSGSYTNSCTSYESDSPCNGMSEGLKCGNYSY